MKRPKYKKFHEWKSDNRQNLSWVKDLNSRISEFDKNKGKKPFIVANRTGKVRSVASIVLEEMGVPPEQINKMLDNVFLEPGI